MGPTFSHELFEELDAFDPKWQEHYETLREAASAAQVLPMYYLYMSTADGSLRHIRHSGIPNTVRANKLERNMRERMLRRSNRITGDEE